VLDATSYKDKAIWSRAAEADTSYRYISTTSRDPLVPPPPHTHTRARARARARVLAYISLVYRATKRAMCATTRTSFDPALRSRGSALSGSRNVAGQQWRRCVS